MAEFADATAPILTRTRSFSLGPESDVGNTEYKRHLLAEDLDRIDKLTTQMSFRLHEGKGKACYRLGVEDNGSLALLNYEDLEKSINMLEMIAESISAKLCKTERVQYRIVNKDGAADGPDSYYHALIDVETCYEDETSKIDVRIAVCGNVDAGKSTMIGVMKTGLLDDGRGSARTTTMSHAHEIESGRTSTVSHHVIGYKSDGKITNYEHGCRQPTLGQITEESARLCTFIDLAGHEKYLRSMIYGVSSSLLDYAVVLVNSRAGVTHMTHHHLTLVSMLNIPAIILFTKIDSCPESRYQQTLEETRELLKAPDVKKRLLLINTAAAKGSDAESATGEGTSAAIAGGGTEASRSAAAAAVALKNVLTPLSASRQVHIPAFAVSFTEGTNLEFFRRVCRFLPKRRRHAEKAGESLEFLVDRIYHVPNVGPVLYGFVNQGTIKCGSTLWMGPFSSGSEGKGDYIRTTAKSIHYNCLSVRQVGAGNFCTVAVKLDKHQVQFVRRGQALLETAPTSCTRFRAKVNIIYSQSTTIKVGYSPYLHILMVRQAAFVEHVEILSRGTLTSSILKAGEEERDKGNLVRPGDVSIITFRFAHKAEYIREQMRLIFRDGKAKGIGVITELLPDDDDDAAAAAVSAPVLASLRPGPGSLRP